MAARVFFLPSLLYWPSLHVRGENGKIFVGLGSEICADGVQQTGDEQVRCEKVGLAGMVEGLDFVTCWHSNTTTFS